MYKLFKINTLMAAMLATLGLCCAQIAMAQPATETTGTATTVSQTKRATPSESYSDQDRYKAIIMCMTVEYVQLYQAHPAEEDAMDICNARYQRLIEEIPYAHYKQWLSDTPYSPYPGPETSALLEKYHRIMLGLDEAKLLIN